MGAVREGVGTQAEANHRHRAAAGEESPAGFRPRQYLPAMKYWFDGDDAQRWGLPAAAVLAHIVYWIERNEHETGRPCITQTIKQMRHYIPFLSEKQIRAARDSPPAPYCTRQEPRHGGTYRCSKAGNGYRAGPGKATRGRSGRGATYRTGARQDERHVGRGSATPRRP